MSAGDAVVTPEATKRRRGKSALKLENGQIVPVSTADPRDAQIVRLDKMVLRMRQELQQYHNDLVFWKTAHGNEYPARRLMELARTIEEINGL